MYEYTLMVIRPGEQANDVWGRTSTSTSTSTSNKHACSALCECIALQCTDSIRRVRQYYLAGAKMSHATSDIHTATSKQFANFRTNEIPVSSLRE